MPSLPPPPNRCADLAADGQIGTPFLVWSNWCTLGRHFPQEGQRVALAGEVIIEDRASRQCSKCGERKPLDQFNRKGPNRRQDRCRACNSAYLKDHYRDNVDYYKAKAKKNRRVARINARRFIWAYFAAHPCVDCGEGGPVVLQFDHVRGEKSFNIGSALGSGFSEERVLAEISKCEVRCSNCHWRRTARQFGWYAYMRNSRG